MMLKVATLITIAMLAVNASAAPQRAQTNKVRQPRLRRDKPSVYISFERVGKAEHSVFFYSSSLPKPPVETK
jgi:hypothetical protein